MAVALGDEAGRHRRSSSTRLLFSMRSLPAGQKHTVGLVQHAPVVGVVEVPEGGKPAHHAIEALIRSGQQGAYRL